MQRTAQARIERAAYHIRGAYGETGGRQVQIGVSLLPAFASDADQSDKFVNQE
jgi:hypothetical protein